MAGFTFIIVLSLCGIFFFIVSFVLFLIFRSWNFYSLFGYIIWFCTKYLIFSVVFLVLSINLHEKLTNFYNYDKCVSCVSQCRSHPSILYEYSFCENILVPRPKESNLISFHIFGSFLSESIVLVCIFAFIFIFLPLIVWFYYEKAKGLISRFILIMIELGLTIVFLQNSSSFFLYLKNNCYISDLPYSFFQVLHILYLLFFIAIILSILSYPVVAESIFRNDSCQFSFFTRFSLMFYFPLCVSYIIIYTYLAGIHFSNNLDYFPFLFSTLAILNIVITPFLLNGIDSPIIDDHLSTPQKNFDEYNIDESETRLLLENEVKYPTEWPEEL